MGEHGIGPGAKGTFEPTHMIVVKCDCGIAVRVVPVVLVLDKSNHAFTQEDWESRSPPSWHKDSAGQWYSGVVTRKLGKLERAQR